MPMSTIFPSDRRPTPHRGIARLAILVALAAIVALTSLPPLVPAASADDDEAGGGEARAEIILYATDWCPWCRKTRTLLAELGVEYADKDIEKSPEAAREHREKAGPGVGVPVLDIGGTIVRGYDPEQIRELVAEMQAERAR